MIKHIDAASHTRGESQYIDDMWQPADLLHAAVYASPVAHGKIVSIEMQDALKVEGVAAVFTAQDIPGRNQHGTIIQDDLVLADKDVHYIGEPVAVVVARTPEIARAGVKRVRMEVKESPGVFDAREAYAKGEIIGQPLTFTLGDVDSVWEKCAIVVAGSTETGGQEHAYLETQSARVIPLEGNTWRVYASTQSPTAVQKTIALMLNIPFPQVEVDVPRLGGGFGGKEDQATQWAAIAALSAWKLKRPVQIVLSRAEDVRMTGKRHPYSSDFKMGLSKEGKILAYEVKMYQNAGATADLSPAILYRSLFHATNAYYVPNVRAFAVSCRTNLLSNTAFRGFGGPQGMFVIEAAIAKAAEKLGMAKEEIQRKNLIKEGEMFSYHQQVNAPRAERTWDEAMQIYKISDIKKEIQAYNDKHYETKKGCAVMPICFGISFTTTFLNQASALVHIYTDGNISVSTNGVEMGQGVNTNLTEITARALGVRPERIKIESNNTKRTVNMSASAASACTDLNGNALLHATAQLCERLYTFAASELKLADKAKVAVVAEKVLYDGKETGWNWDKLIISGYLNRVDLSAHGFYATPNIAFDAKSNQGNAFAYHVFGTAIIEVTVDCLRGTYDIDAVKLVHDGGSSVNQLILRGQVEGGLAQGLGWMTLEEIKFNEKGLLLSNALASYKVPETYFMPDDIQVKFLEGVDNPASPFGAKAVGEPPLMYGIGVFFAIRSAMQTFSPNKTFAFNAPMTPERVLMELHGDYLKEVQR
jgi:xanthine dehydrogenase large subunit